MPGVRGRVLLAGDAAHQMPPFMAQGLCSGLRDAGNLGWKLISVLRDNAPDTLLDTYEQERKPHLRQLVETTKKLGLIIGELDPAIALARDERLGREMSEGSDTVRQKLGARPHRGLDRSEPQTARPASRPASFHLNRMLWMPMGASFSWTNSWDQGFSC